MSRSWLSYAGSGSWRSHYVAVKAVREERPDVDDTYMRAVMLLTGNGGWPMRVWSTPERQVLFAGTYVPPHDGDRDARYGFSTLLQRFADGYRANPSGVLQEGRS